MRQKSLVLRGTKMTDRINTDDLTAQDFIDLSMKDIQSLVSECRENIQRGVR